MMAGVQLAFNSEGKLGWARDEFRLNQEAQRESTKKRHQLNGWKLTDIGLFRASYLRNFSRPYRKWKKETIVFHYRRSNCNSPATLTS